MKIMQIRGLQLAVVSYALSLAVSEPGCPLGAKYPFPPDCRKYITCDNTVTTTLDCQAPKHFVYADQECRAGAPCQMKPSRTDRGLMCVFPFTYRRYTFYACTRQYDAAGMLWCSTHAVFANPHLAYCQPTQYFTGKLISHTGLLLNRVDYGEFENDINSNEILTTAIYIDYINSTNYQFDVDLNIDGSAANVSGIMYNAQDKNQYDYVYLHFDVNGTCATLGHVMRGVRQRTVIRRQPLCDSDLMEIGRWMAVAVRVFDSNKAYLLINDVIVTKALRPKGGIIGWVGLILENGGVRRGFKFRNLRLSAHDDTYIPEPDVDYGDDDEDGGDGDDTAHNDTYIPDPDVDYDDDDDGDDAGGDDDDAAHNDTYIPDPDVDYDDDDGDDAGGDDDDADEPPSPVDAKTMGIAGGFLLLICLLVALICYLVRRKKNVAAVEQTIVSPMPSPMPSPSPSKASKHSHKSNSSFRE